MRGAVFYFAVLVLILGAEAVGDARAAQPPQVLTRVFFLDDESQTVKWAELLAGDKPTMGPVREISGFPKLDPARQKIVALKAAAGTILAAVRDTQDDGAPRGWVLIECGAYEEAHGDHSHWIYPVAPRIRAAVLDDQQPPPSQIYEYEGVFYLAHGGHGGFTRIDPTAMSPTESGEAIRRRAAFHAGGGGRSSLAAVGKVVAFSAWDDREGPNKGRVDVTALRTIGNDNPTFSFQLPYGGIHATTANHGKVFFASPDGLSWVEVPRRISAETPALPVRHVAMGTPDAGTFQPISFANFGRYVTFVSDVGPNSAFCFVDASANEPRVMRLPLGMAEGRSPGNYELTRSRKGLSLAFVFQESAADANPFDVLSVLELDPDRNGDWSDAKVAHEIKIGAGPTEGKAGRHSLAVEADRRRALYTNPGDGTVMVLSIEDRKTITGFKVGGTPTTILAVGGRVSNH